MRYLSFIAVLLVVACTDSPTSGELHENKSQLVGNWFYSNSNGQVQGKCMEFHEDGTGVLGPVVNINGKEELNTYTSLLMKDWRIQKDTLYIQSEMQSGLVIMGPDGLEIEQNSTPNILRFVVLETSDSHIVLKDLNGPVPVREQFRKAEKMVVH